MIPLDASPTRDRATQLLNRLSSGERGVESELLELLYAELRQLARGHMAREAKDHTLQPTALVHEAWMVLVDQPGASFESRRQFYRLASMVMRSVLVDHARRKKAEKRGGDRVQLALDEWEPAATGGAASPDVLDLDQALTELAAVDEELSRVVELRFFGGLSMQQAAEALELPLRTAERRLGVATAWLRERLDG